MEKRDLFILSESYLPGCLTSEEFNEYFKKYKLGDKMAREKIIKGNIRLVIDRVLTRFSGYPDKEELVSVGIVGLILALESFDESRGVKFSTYATIGIERKILQFLKSEKRDRIVSFEDEDKEFEDDKDMVADFENEETSRIIRELIQELPEKDRKIISLCYGFTGNRKYTKRELAKMFNVSHVTIHKIINQALDTFEEILYSRGLIEKRKRCLDSK